MHILVIGGTRFVGYHLVWRLLAAGHRVTILNRGTLADPFGERVERLRADRTTAAFGEVVQGRSFDGVVDFAAYTGADAQGAIDALGDRIGHYVCISSGQVYLVREGAPRPARETDYDGPVTPPPPAADDLANWEYGTGKRAAEDALITAWNDIGFPSTRLRLPMVNGERDDARRMESYLWRLLDGGPILLPDGGRQIARHVYSGAVVQAICDLLGKESTHGRAYNLAQTEAPTVAGVVVALGEVLGSSVQLLNVSAEALASANLERRAVSPFSSRWMSFVDPMRAEAELGFRHPPLREYLGRIVACFLAHPPSEPPSNYRGRQAELGLAAQLSS